MTAIEGGIRNGTAPVNSSNSTVANLSVPGGSTFRGPVALFGGTFVGLQSTSFSGASTRFDDIIVADTATMILVGGNSTSIAISGITMPLSTVSGRVLYIVNTEGGATLTLLNADANSAAQNRMQFIASGNKVLNNGGAALLIYDGVSNLWRGM